MRKEPNKRLIGFFVFAGFFILFGIIIHFVMKKAMPNNSGMVVMYFEESIKGLNVGSSVIFEGVEVGKVSKIELLTSPDNLDFSIPVYAKFQQDETFSELKAPSKSSKKDLLLQLIQKGLRARLVNQSYLTGQLMIELQMLPNTPVVFRQKEFHPARTTFEIPTVPSVGVSVSKELQEMPLKQILIRTDNILKSLETDLPQILPQFKTLGINLNKLVNRTSPQTENTFRQLNQTLDDVGSAAKALRNFADYIERHPESLLQGKGKY